MQQRRWGTASPGRRGAFTLVELMMVVAIVAILSLIGAATVQSVMVRVQVTQARMDMHLIAHALERRAADWGGYPATMPHEPLAARFRLLSTPIAYTSSTFMDPFRDPGTGESYEWDPTQRTYELLTDRHPYHALWFANRWGGGCRQWIAPSARYILASQGPDLVRNRATGDPAVYWMPYDPTNGTFSQGDLFTFGPGGTTLGG